MSISLDPSSNPGDIITGRKYFTGSERLTTQLKVASQVLSPNSKFPLAYFLLLLGASELANGPVTWNVSFRNAEDTLSH